MKDILQRLRYVLASISDADSMRPPSIPCRGRKIETVDWGVDYDCDYEHSGSFGCEDCLVNGGRYDPRTGRST